MLLLFVGGTAWNRSLHRQVQARTKAVERTERRYRDLVDNASDMIYRTDPFGRFTFVNPVATRILGFDEGELLSMKYFELMRPGLGAARDGLLREGGEDARVHLSRVPGPQEGRRGDLGRPARAADHHRRPHRRLPGHGARHHRSRQRPVGAARRARLRLGDPRHRAEPDHGARLAGPHRALQPRLRRAVRRVDVGSRRPAVLGGAVPPRRRSRRDSRRHSAPGGRRPSRSSSIAPGSARTARGT